MTRPDNRSQAGYPRSHEADFVCTPVKCLIVDDTEENLIALEALLRSDDVQVLKAHSGPQALELLLEHDVALALLDVQMPGMNGFELAELMRGSLRTRHVPIIFVTAGARDQHRVFTGYEAGAVDFLYKPIDPMILANKAAVFFELHRQRAAVARELEQRTRTLQMNEMFIAVLGHDLRSPLMTVLASSAVLLRNPDADMVRKTGERLKSTVQRMSKMVEDLLDVTRARLGGGFAMAPSRVNLGGLIQHVVHEMETHAGRPVHVVVQGDLVGQWDAARLSQAAVNLIGNALQHGDPARPVEVFLNGDDPDIVQLTVANGGAIPAETLPNIFDPFYRSQYNVQRSAGLGLGLYIVYQIVLGHHGSIDVQSDVDTRIVIRLPRHALALSAEGAPPARD